MPPRLQLPMPSRIRDGYSHGVGSSQLLSMGLDDSLQRFDRQITGFDSDNPNYLLSYTILKNSKKVTQYQYFIKTNEIQFAGKLTVSVRLTHIGAQTPRKMRTS
jgi:hypothetical protein